MRNTEHERQFVIDEARRWIGTPYVHQKRLRGVAVDCIGLVWGVGEACDVLWIDPGRSQRYLGYGRLPSPRRFLAALAQFWLPIRADEARDADIVALAWDRSRAMPQHLAILANDRGRRTIIHAEGSVGKCAEHGFTSEWPSRVHSYWRYPGLG